MFLCVYIKMSIDLCMYIMQRTYIYIYTDIQCSGFWLFDERTEG